MNEQRRRLEKPTYGGGTDTHPEYRITPNGLEPPGKLKPWTMLYMGNMVLHPPMGLAFMYCFAAGLPYVGNSGWLGLTYGGAPSEPAAANLAETVSFWAGLLGILLVMLVAANFRFYFLIVTTTLTCAVSTACWCIGALQRFTESMSNPSSAAADQVHIGYFLLPVLTASRTLMLGSVWKGCEWVTRPNGNQLYERNRYAWDRRYYKMAEIKQPFERVPRREVGGKRWLLLGCVGAFVFFLSAPVVDGLNTFDVFSVVGDNQPISSTGIELIFLVLAIVGVVGFGMWVVLSNRAGNAVYWAWLLSCSAQWWWMFGLVIQEKEGRTGGTGSCYDYGYYWLFFTSIAASIVLYLINNDRDAHESANAQWRQAQRHETMIRFNVYLG